MVLTHRSGHVPSHSLMATEHFGRATLTLVSSTLAISLTSKKGRKLAWFVREGLARRSPSRKSRLVFEQRRQVINASSPYSFVSVVAGNRLASHPLITCGSFVRKETVVPFEVSENELFRSRIESTALAATVPPKSSRRRRRCGNSKGRLLLSSYPPHVKARRSMMDLDFRQKKGHGV